MDTIKKIIQVALAFAIVFLLPSCRTQHVTGHLDAFLNSEISRYGGKVEHFEKGSDNLYGNWTYKRDRFGTVIISPDVSFNQIDDFLKQIYGRPIEAGQRAGGVQQWVIPAKIAGVSIWYFEQGNGVEISVVRNIEIP